MDVHYHVGFTSLLAVILYPHFGWMVVLLFVGGVLVDVDHLLWYALRYGDWNPLWCHRTYMVEGAKNNYHDFDGSLNIFYTIEFVILLSIAAMYSPSAFVVLCGYAGHVFLDAIWLLFFVKRSVINYSIVYWLWLNKIKTVK